MLISTGEDENEIMTIQVDVGSHRIRIINAYGPQEDDSTQKVLSFWQEIEAEVLTAKDNDCMIIIEMDANAKVGNTVIKGDPHMYWSDNKRKGCREENRKICYRFHYHL